MIPHQPNLEEVERIMANMREDMRSADAGSEDMDNHRQFMEHSKQFYEELLGKPYKPRHPLVSFVNGWRILYRTLGLIRTLKIGWFVMLRASLRFARVVGLRFISKRFMRLRRRINRA